MNTDSSGRRKGLVFLLPAAMAFPVIAAMVFLTVRIGPVIHKLISIAIKMAVTA